MVCLLIHRENVLLPLQHFLYSAQASVTIRAKVNREASLLAGSYFDLSAAGGIATSISKRVVHGT